MNAPDRQKDIVTSRHRLHTVLKRAANLTGSQERMPRVHALLFPNVHVTKVDERRKDSFHANTTSNNEQLLLGLVEQIHVNCAVVAALRGKPVPSPRLIDAALPRVARLARVEE